MELGLTIVTLLESAILLLLFGLSIWSAAIMIDRKRTLGRERSTEDLESVKDDMERGDRSAVRAWCESHTGIHAGALLAALSVGGDLESIDRSVRAYLITERMRLERGLSVLATLGANAPFIGLFGTVLGIIRAFAALGSSSAAASSVMSGISLALIATAAGLFVAIPAVVAFNVFSTRIRFLVSECDALRDLYVAALRSSQSGSGGL
jgi:biopolymer transport protein ExbB